MDKELFNALCDLVIYHYCDLLRPKKTGKKKFAASVELLHSRGIIADSDDPGRVWDCYDEMVAEFALEHLPSGYAERVDFWGAKIISKDTGWDAPKSGLYAGDDSGHFMYFDDFAALDEYTQEKLAELAEF